MAPLSLRIVQDGGAVTRKVKLEPSLSVREALAIIQEKANLPPEAKAYGLFLPSADSELAGVWLDERGTLSDYLLRDGDLLHYSTKMRNLRLRMLDDTIKTFQVDQSKLVGELMLSICSKLGITNHEEYGLCFDEAERAEPKDRAGHAGTLTAKKKSKLDERDLQFEQLSKKLNTDDNVAWLDPHSALAAAGVAPTQTLLLKRRLFYSDRRVDARDPVQLNLLYRQARDGILHATHPVTVDKAVEFAGIQCQIQFGDYNEQKHRPGFLQNLSEYLPRQYCGAWGVEKKILKEYSTHAGLTELDAKHLYTKTARELPTYGVTFFLVKEKQKGKKKLVPRLLGISAESILRLDESTKEVVQTWPLTHVKTYHAGKGETFTLNFGDYADKEYSVKTRDAFRIRDILESYIDLIRKRMLAHYQLGGTEHGTVGQDNVNCGSANLIQHVSNNPSKMIEETIVGPNRILPQQPGQRASNVGTHLVTAQQMIITELKNKQDQNVVKAEVSMRKDMGVPFTRRLNRLNSNSVKIVNILAEPSRAHLEDAHKIATEMEADMPTIRNGVADTIEKQTSEAERKKLQDQMKRLNELLRSLCQHTGPGTADAAEAEEAAKQIASLSTEMYFAIAPESKRRSDILNRSRKSFRADERLEKSRHRASYIAATASAAHALDGAADIVVEPYSGWACSPQQARDRELAAVHKLARLNAAVAHYLLAHSDPQNVDYATAINSLNAVHELVPDLARDGQILASISDDKDRTAIINDIKQLCGAAKHLCSLSGVEDPQKLRDGASKYAEVSGRLVYLFGRRGGKARADKENQIIDLTEEVVEQTSQLLNCAQSLASQHPADPAALQVRDAAAHTAHAAKLLMTQTTLNAPTIEEPHCQSALTAASEALSASAQRLAVSWAPLAEMPSHQAEKETLHHQTMELAKALDKLREAYSGSDDQNTTKATSKLAEDGETSRLQFINSLSRIGDNWKTDEDLEKPLPHSASEHESSSAKLRLSDDVAQLSAAVAALLAATTDREHADYGSAAAAVAVIDQLMPRIVEDSKLASAHEEAASRAALLSSIRELCAATKKVCASAYGAEPDVLNEAISQFADSSGRLIFVCNRRSNPRAEEELLGATSEACACAGALLAGVQQVSEGGARGGELDERGALAADAARALFSVAQITAPSISDPRCQSTFLSAVDKVTSTSSALQQSWQPLSEDHKYSAQVLALDGAKKELDKHMENLRRLCQIAEEDTDSEQVEADGAPSTPKLQLVATMRGAQQKLADAQKELKKPAMPAKGSDMAAVQHRLDAGLQQLSAAMAALLAAAADSELPDNAVAAQAADTITSLMPQIIRDTKTVSASRDEDVRAAMLAQVATLCRACQAVCASPYGDEKGRDEAVAQFADASSRLVFVAHPRRKTKKQDKICELCEDVCKEVSALSPQVLQLSNSARGLLELGQRLQAAAQGLKQTAQLLAPSLESQQSLEALLSSSSAVTSSSWQLAAAVAPLQDDPKHRDKAQHVMKGLNRLEDIVDELRSTCVKPDHQEQKRQQYVKALEANKDKWADLQRELSKPIPPSRGGDTAAVEGRLASRLADLDLAVAALLASTADKDASSYEEAQDHVKTITELLPQIVQYTKTVSADKDQKPREAMLSAVEALCRACEGVCASSHGTNVKALDEAVSEYSAAADRLVFEASPTRKPKEVLERAQSACASAEPVLAASQRLAAELGAAQAQQLVTDADRLSDAVKNMLHTAQVTNTSLSTLESQSAALDSAERARRAALALSRSLSALGTDSPRASQLAGALNQLLARLDGMKQTIDKEAQQSLQEQQRVQYIHTCEAAKEKWTEALKHLNKPISRTGCDIPAAEDELRCNLAALSAAVAGLLTNTADKDRPSYGEAERSVARISDTLLQIAQDANLASAGQERRAAMLAEVESLCDACRSLCDSSYGEDKGTNEAVAKYCDVSRKLMHAVHTPLNTEKEKKVLEEVEAACSSTAGLLGEVQQLVAESGQLDAAGGRLADSAHNLLHTAQVTSACLDTPECEAALYSAIDAMSAAASDLEGAVTAAGGGHLLSALRNLQQQLEDLKKTCRRRDSIPPPPSRPAPTLPAVPLARAVHGGPLVQHTQDFLDTLKMEETMGRSPSSANQAVVRSVQKKSAQSTDDDKINRENFNKSLEDARKSIKVHETELMKQCRSVGGAGAALSHREMMGVRSRLVQHLALAGVQVAGLVDANYADKVDYSAGLESTRELPQLMTNIVKDGTQLADNLNEMARKAFLYDMLQLCEAGTKICDAGLTERQRLNDAAVHFGDTSTKLLYVVSSDVNPDLEKEIISRAKAIGDSASHLALEAANVATAAAGTASGSVQQICDAGTACVDAAGKLVYTAKLTAPSIHEAACREALTASTETLSTKLKSFADSWAPMASDPNQASTISQLGEDADKLQHMLAALRGDVQQAGGRELRRFTVEDTPIRQLTLKILDEAKLRTECPCLPAEEKIAYASYADRVSEALQAVDAATARAKAALHDTERRRELERAVQNLQMILLQSRPSRGEKRQTNIVDLMEFMEEVATEAQNLSSTANVATVASPQDRLVLEEIKDKCDVIHSKASRLMRGEVDSDLEFNDLFDQFGQECEDVVRRLTADVKGMEETKTKKLLWSKVMALSESCYMLRFATKSGISTEACCTLDASLDELEDIEARLVPAIVQETAHSGVTLRPKKVSCGRSLATLALCRAVSGPAVGVSAAAVTAYIADAASRSDGSHEDKNKLMKHLYKLVQLLKTLAASRGARAATWRPLQGPDTARLVDQILEEIYHPESTFGVKEEKQKILAEDVYKLLTPAAPKILGDSKQQEDKLTRVASQLSAACSSVSQAASGAVPGDVARNVAHLAGVAADHATELDAIARGVHITDPVQRRKVDEAAKEMSFATYNVLKLAESSCLEANSSNLKRRLADALSDLNHSIDKLVWHVSSSPVLSRACGALARGAAAQLAALQPRPTAVAPYSDTCDLLLKQSDYIAKLNIDSPMPRKEFMRNLDDIGSAVRTSVDCAAHCAYYIAISDRHKDVAKIGLVDVPRIQRSIEAVQDSCLAVIGASHVDQAKELKEDLHKRVLDFSTALDQAQMQVKDLEVKRSLSRARSCVGDAAADLETGIQNQVSMEQITAKAVSLLEAVSTAHGLVEQCPLVPAVGDMSLETRATCDDVIDQSKSLLSSTLALIADVQAAADEDPELMTWVSFNTGRKKLVDAYDSLLKAVRRNGHRAGIYEKAPEEDEEEKKKELPKKSYIEIQVDLASKWLRSSVCKADVKTAGQQAANNVIDMARQMSEELKGAEREELRAVLADSEHLLADCCRKYDHEKNSLLMDRLKELKKSVQRGVVTRVVEDFIEADTPLADLDTLADCEPDESKRQFLLERKVAALLAQLGRVSNTARFVGHCSQDPQISAELAQCTQQSELLAPMLVQAAQKRVDHPDDKTLIENYKLLLARYAESISKVRDLCDRALDPMAFVQTAGDTMQRMREDMTQHSNDPQKCAYTSTAISKLANRVINVSMSSNAVANDPELQRALVEAKERLLAATPAADTRASRLPHWKDTTAEILRTTGDVESALGGETIFKKEPTTANQPIFSVARSLHESVREWSSRDNEIVAVARRVAVLMARLSEYMETDKKDDLITTSKSIVVESQEVAELAKKLAHECSDIRIKTNLLQTCERIPTISGQLKIVTAVKAATLGQQAAQEDKEAMDMLVGNAQSLMMSISDVVKAAASASVKIMSQRGPRLRWVRKTYY